MPTRILLRLVFFVGLAAPLCASALGVGQLEVRSALNEIFEAELPLIANNRAEFTGLTVQIPRQEEFDRAGIERLAFLSKLRFSVQTPPGGPDVIRITSLDPVREPNFTLLLELVWPRGRLLREFTIQLDPELYANRRPPPPPFVAPPPVTALPVVPPVAVAPAAPQLPPAPPVSFEGASFYGPVKPGETLMAIANRVRPTTTISVPQMMAILLAGNPAAFINGNPNALRSGATLKVPTPQALGALAATPALAAAPAATEPPRAPAPADLTTPGPTAASVPESVSPPVTAETPTPTPASPLPVTPPLVAVPPPTAPAPVAEPGLPTPPTLSPAEPLREIAPQAAIPQTEAPPPVAAQPLPEPAPPPPVVSEPQPARPVTPPVAAEPQPAPVAKPPTPPPAEAEPSWISNPIVWVAIALIALAIAAMILLPLLRRPARTKPSAVETPALEFPETAAPAVEPSVAATTRTQRREPVSAPPRPTPGLGAAAPAALDKAASPPSPAPTPKPLRELLEGFEVGPGGEGRPPAATLQGGAPGQELKAPLFESEPPTASGVPRSTAAKQEKESPAQTETALPPELRLDGLDFDFGELTLDKTARQPSELPPLEMKPAALGAKKPFEPPPLGLGITEPATEPPSLAPTAAPPADSAKMGLKFEFADVTQELARYDTGDESLKLGEALQGLSGEALKPGGRAEKDRVAIPTGGMDATDYVETKLDLAMAYLDMGDQVGARSLLDEVLREGNAAQKERAEKLLKKPG